MQGQPAAKTAADQLTHAGDDRHGAVAQTLQRVAEDHQEAQNRKQRADDRQIVQRPRRYGRVGIAQHQADGKGFDKPDDEPGGDAVHNLNEAAVPDALFDAVVAARTVVLAHVGGHGHTHAFHRQGEHLANFFARRLGGHHHAAHQVDGVLHDDRSDSGDRILKPHGQADDRQPLAVGRGEAGVLFGKPDALHLGEEPPGAEQAAEQLADDGGQCRAVHAHAHRHDERPVQPDVYNAGPQQKVERMLGIAQRPQHAGRVVVQHRGRDAQKDDPDVLDGVRKNIVRRVDELQQRRGQQGS